MPRYLLTGAGFSKNWGGWLANEAFEYLLGTDELHPRARRYLWDHKERGTGFEGAYQALKDEAANPADREVFEHFNQTVAGMFHLMNRGFASIEIHPTICRFLASFDAIFTLNQDTLLEQKYFRDDILKYSDGTFFGADTPGVEEASILHAMPAASCIPRAAPYSVRDRYQPYFKLHGSSTWVVPDNRKWMLILGGNKSAEITNQPLLHWYHQEFARLIAGARLMIIGYSFGDDHINKILSEAATRDTRFFIVDPNGVDIIDKRNRAVPVTPPRQPLMETLMNSIDGASRRPLISTLMQDPIERTKLKSFMEP